MHFLPLLFLELVFIDPLVVKCFSRLCNYRLFCTREWIGTHIVWTWNSCWIGVIRPCLYNCTLAWIGTCIMQCSFCSIFRSSVSGKLVQVGIRNVSKCSSSTLLSCICLHMCCNCYKVLCFSFTHLFVLVMSMCGLVPLKISAEDVSAPSTGASLCI